MNEPTSTTPISMSGPSQQFLKELRTNPLFQGLLREMLSDPTAPRLKPYRPKKDCPPEAQMWEWVYLSGQSNGARHIVIALLGFDPTEQSK